MRYQECRKRKLNGAICYVQLDGTNGTRIGSERAHGQRYQMKWKDAFSIKHINWLIG